MRCSYTIDVLAGRINEKWTGRVTLGDIAECLEHQQSHPDFSLELDGFVDLSDAMPDLTFPETQGVAARHPFTGRWAFLAPADAAFGTIRMYIGAVSERRSVGVFRTRDEAMAWLSGEDTLTR